MGSLEDSGPAGRVWPLIGAAGIAAWFLCFAGGGLHAQFSGDDLMNLHYYVGRPLSSLLLDHLRYWSSAYRPLGGLFYVSSYAMFGLNPAPLRIVCFCLMAFNLAILFSFTRILSSSGELAFLATFLASFHAWFIDLYYNSATIYDLLCFAFYFSALTYYARIRGQGRTLSLRQMLVVAALYIFALNAKEMAVTLPLFLGLYELLLHWREPGMLRHARTTLLTAAMTVPYAAGKLSGPDSLIQVPAYRMVISPVRFLKTFHLYLNPLFYVDHVFHDSNTVQLLLVMLGIALVWRSRIMLFSWFFLLLAILPVAFMAHYAAFFLYIPFAGWAIFIAGLLHRIALSLRLSPTAKGFALIAIACVLAPLHLRERAKTLRDFSAAQPPTRELRSELLQAAPRMKHGARVLFIDDPIRGERDRYVLFFLTTLLYRDPSITVQRTILDPALAGHLQDFDVVLRFRNGHFTAASI